MLVTWWLVGLVALARSQDWTAVSKGDTIDIDLQQDPLQIKTNSTAESNDKIRLEFYKQEHEPAGGLNIYFFNPIQYFIHYCTTSRSEFSTAPPAEQDKVWTILRTDKGLKVECNGVLVLHYDISQCTSSSKHYWKREVKKIMFHGTDTASDEYRVVRATDKCPAGEYRNKDMMACTPCAHNKISDQAGAASCTPCVLGTVANNDKTQCEGCAAGTHRESSMNICTPCPGNSYSTAAATYCADCSEGSVSNTGKTGCEDCAAGTHRESGMSNCTPCPGNSYSTAAATYCTDCPEGSVSNTNKTDCEDCAAGRYRESDMSICTPCTGNSYSTAAATFCTACPEGSVSNTDKTDCEDCAAGTYRESGMSINCTPCPANTYSTAAATSCTDCSEGSVSNTDKTDCEDCAAGTYRESSRSICTPCTGNSYSTAAATSCTDCTEGFMSNAEKTGCEVCAAGTYRESGMSNCTPCPANTYSTAAATSCTDCSEGSVSNTDKTGCDSCAPGWYSIEGGMPPCTKCYPGEYQPNPKQTACLPCSGTVNMDSTSCTPSSIKQCDTVSISLPWLNGGELIEFPATPGGNLRNVACPGDKENRVYKRCLESGYWSPDVNSDSCQTALTPLLTPALNLATTAVNMISGSTSGDMKDVVQQVDKAMDKFLEVHTRPSPRDSNEILEMLSKIKILITLPSVEPGNLQLNMIKSVEILGNGESDFFAEDKKSEIINIVESVSRSLKEGDANIDTDTIAVRAIKSKEKEVSLDAPKNVPKESLPIKLVFGKQRGLQTNVVLMDESYKEILPKPKEENSTIGSPIVSVNFMETGNGGDIEFSLIFQQNGNETQSGYANDWTCVYLDTAVSEWKSDGCTTLLNKDGTCTCTCTHTTSFAVLLSLTEITDPAQDIVSYVMFGINVSFLSLTLCLIAPFKKLRSKQLVTIQLNLTLALLLANVSFTALSATTKIKVDEDGNPLLSLNTGCVAGVIISQYLFLSAICWMSCTAWSLFGKIVNAPKSYGRKDKFYVIKCCVLSWIAPVFLPVASFLTSWSMNNNEEPYVTPYVGAQHKNDTNCWIEPPWRWIGFMVPSYLLLLFSCACFGMIARVIIHSAMSGKGKPNLNLIKTAIALTMVCVAVGCPWLIAAITFDPLAGVMQYLFIILTGLQGPFLFVALVLFQDDVKAHTFALFDFKVSRDETMTTSSTNVQSHASCTGAANMYTTSTIQQMTGVSGKEETKYGTFNMYAITQQKTGASDKEEISAEDETGAEEETRVEEETGADEDIYDTLVEE